MGTVFGKGVEEVSTDGKATSVEGDSGGPALEENGNGELVITGIISARMIESISNPRFVVVNEKTGEKTEIAVDEKNKDTENWGLISRKSLDSVQIKKYLKEKQLLGGTGELLPGYFLERLYDRKVKTSIVDLSLKENQDFLRETMSAK